jgi:hypothetical protein
MGHLGDRAAQPLDDCHAPAITAASWSPGRRAPGDEDTPLLARKETQMSQTNYTIAHAMRRAAAANAPGVADVCDRITVRAYP